MRKTLILIGLLLTMTSAAAAEEVKAPPAGRSGFRNGMAGNNHNAGDNRLCEIVRIPLCQNTVRLGLRTHQRCFDIHHRPRMDGEGEGGR